jgi:hypothetical protein
MQALLNDLEIVSDDVSLARQQQTAINSLALQGSSVTDFIFTGPKLYVDVAWKKGPNHASATAGIRVYFTMKLQE